MVGHNQKSEITQEENIMFKIQITDKRGQKSFKGSEQGDFKFMSLGEAQECVEFFTNGAPKDARYAYEIVKV